MKFKRDLSLVLLGSIISFILYNLFAIVTTNIKIEKNEISMVKQNSASSIPIPMEDFPEPFWRTNQTLEARTVASTPFARFEIHKVKTEDGNIVNDWLWTDEKSHVNIFVHLKEEDKFLLFKQRKYGYEGLKYATVGGLFDPNETPEQCAQRELLEETGLVTQELYNLGKYRVQVNRGGGFLYIFYARNCIWKNSLRSNINNKNISHDKEKYKNDYDYEMQEMNLLTREEVINLVLNGEIGEAQWLAAITTSLLFENKLSN